MGPEAFFGWSDADPEPDPPTFGTKQLYSQAALFLKVVNVVVNY
jgi:hypothetical protein